MRKFTLISGICLQTMILQIAANKIGQIDDVMLSEVTLYGFQKSSQHFEDLEKKFYDQGNILSPDEPAHFLNAFSLETPEAREIAKYGKASIEATKYLAENLALSREELAFDLEKFNMKSTEAIPKCPFDEKTNKDCKSLDLKFRTADGTCNNLEHPEWGSSAWPHLRFLPASYNDGVQEFRKSASGNELPSARQVSTSVHVESEVDTRYMTMMVMQWGQFVDHDMTFTPMSKGFNKTNIKCCAKDGSHLDLSSRHPECAPIPIPVNDTFFSNFSVTCMDFVRSTPSPRKDCILGNRETLNQATSYIDASSVYGSSDREQNFLRLKKAGLMKTTDFGKMKPLLPPLDWSTFPGQCRVSKPNTECFAGGDIRANEVPGLTAMHTIWIREHNRIVKELAKYNPYWDDERLFQEGRRIVGALNQHITYNEFLPLVLGPTVLDIFNLRIKPFGYSESYNSTVNPTIENSVATAAFRFGHSQIRNSMTRCTKDFKELPINVHLHKELNDPTNIYNPGSIDRIMMGLVAKSVTKTDEFLAQEVTNHLFQMPDQDWGMDLAAINIQRGRDHGINSYNDWRSACGLDSFQGWDDLVSAMKPQSVERLSQVYESVEDIDLFTGGLAEKPVSGGIVGPTFGCLIGQQFLNLKIGDRFWYENGDHEGAFSLEQLQEIRKVSLARIICDNLDNVDKLPPFVFLTMSDKINSPVPCKGNSIPRMNFSKWSTTPVSDYQFNFLDEEKTNLLGVLSGIPETEAREHDDVSNELPSPISPGHYYNYFKT